MDHKSKMSDGWFLLVAILLAQIAIIVVKSPRVSIQGVLETMIAFQLWTVLAFVFYDLYLRFRSRRWARALFLASIGLGSIGALMMFGSLVGPTR